MGLFDKFIGSGVSSIVDSVSGAIDRFVQTKEEKEAAVIVKKMLEENKDKFQTEINKIEAGHRNIFVHSRY